MIEEKQRLSRMEMYSGSLVVFVGIFFLFAVLGPLFQNREAVPFNPLTRDFLKLLFYALLNLVGASLFFLRRKPGWAICTGSLFAILLLPMILVFGTWPIVISKEYILPLLFLILAFLALAFMFNKTVRKNHRVNNGDYLITFTGYALFFSVYYLL